MLDCMLEEIVDATLVPITIVNFIQQDLIL